MSNSAATAPAGGDSSSSGPASGQPATTASATPSAPEGTKASAHPKRVCFKLTGRCVEPRKVPGAQTAGATANAASGGSPNSLDLAAPDVRRVVPAEELKEPLPNNEQITEVQEAQTVAVKGEGPPPEVPIGFGAIWWALNHPSQAWRIFTPAE